MRNVLSMGSIRTKTAFLFFVLFVAIILPVHWIIYKKIKSVIEEASRKEMQWEAEKLMSQIKLDPLIVPLSSSYDIRLQLTGKIPDEILFSSPKFPELPPAIALPDYYILDTLEVLNYSRAEQYAPEVLMLSIVRSNTALVERLSDLSVTLFAASSLSVIVIGILVYLAAGWMLRPIHRISVAASKITASENIDRLPLPNTNDESRTLAEALNAMLDRIEQTIKNQTNFFASATHELKTPLAIMKAELSTLNDHQSLEGLLAEVERLDRVISDFLLISQLKSDSLIIRKTSESLEEIIYRALKKVSRLKDQYQPTIHFKLKDQVMPPCLVDVDKIETVFINLFENAIRYSVPPTPRIIIYVDPVSDYYSVSILNTVKEPIPDVSQLKQEFKKSQELSTGLGMGLWIADQILKLHDGKLVLSYQKYVFRAEVLLPKN
jgi:two-component system heavy metal sensor histidine kinase CusS